MNHKNIINRAKGIFPDPIYPEYKVLDIDERFLVDELNKQGKLGFEYLNILEKKTPNAQSDVTAYKILLRKK